MAQGKRWNEQKGEISLNADLHALIMMHTTEGRNSVLRYGTTWLTYFLHILKLKDVDLRTVALNEFKKSVKECECVEDEFEYVLSFLLNIFNMHIWLCIVFSQKPNKINHCILGCANY